MNKTYKFNFILILISLFGFICTTSLADDGYRLWLRYDPIDNAQLQKAYSQTLSSISFPGNTPTLTKARKELKAALLGLLNKEVPQRDLTTIQANTFFAGTSNSSKIIASLNLQEELKNLGEDGFIIKSIPVKKNNAIVLAANTDAGVLYGTFHFLKLLQTHQSLDKLNIVEKPSHTHRLLNHWDNLDRTVERGYSGFSIWDWHRLPDYIVPQYEDYARANASIGINGTVLTNVNANAVILTAPYLEKTAALADVFRPYNLKVYLTARFSAPRELGGLETSDPLDPKVIAWWEAKVKEIYKYIPDFGGFLVKANSEGQPGPQDYGRNHADGANMLAKAVKPFGGIVMWRAFVYDDNVPVDRSKQAYNEFTPLDGDFLDNVMVQVKNGPIDFQPREPFHPLFGAMPKTPLMMEFQITQEYLGFATHLVYMGPLFKECLDSDTYAKGEGSYVSKVIDGSLDNHQISGMAGVANIGTDRNWTGHPFGQANWYLFGRLAWNNALSSETVADEWIRMTFSNNQNVIKPIKEIMMASHEIVVNYMTPLGLHHQMAWSHHYGPGPWIDEGRPDWTSVYYHRADSLGIGFDRTSTGSDAVSQYFPPVAEKFNNIETCPEKFLLWFHHVKWDHKMKSGNTLWEEMCKKYYEGADSVTWMKDQWNQLENKIDPLRFDLVSQLLDIQHNEAIWWRNSLLLYFQTFSKRPIPSKYEQPEKSLEYYRNLKHIYVPGN